MRWVHDALLQSLLTHVRSSPHADFYTKKYEGFALDREHFFELPLLTRAELVATPLAERTYVAPEEVRFAGFTSGTSSQRPLVTLFADVEDYHVEPSLGLPVRRPLIIYPPLNKNFGHTFMQQCRQAKQPVSPMFADFQNLENSALLAKATACDALYATPTIAALFAPYALEQGIASDIKLLALSSETLTLARRKELARAYPNARIANLYASSEIGQFVMWPCVQLMEAGENHFHIATEALAAVELIEGELVVSYGLNRASPLVRYRTGDVFEEAPACSCGAAGPLLRWSHRSEVDRVRMNGVEFAIEEADRVFARLSRPTSRYQVHFVEAAQGGTQIRVEIEDPGLAGKPDAAVAERALQSELLDGWKLTATATLRDALTKGLFTEVTVCLVPVLSVVGTKAKRFVNHVR